MTTDGTELRLSLRSGVDRSGGADDRVEQAREVVGTRLRDDLDSRTDGCACRLGPDRDGGERSVEGSEGRAADAEASVTRSASGRRAGVTARVR